MKRPYIICHMLMSRNGKTTGNFLFSKFAEKAVEKYYEINRNYDADAFACGRVTMQESFANEKLDLEKFEKYSGSAAFFVAEQPFKKYAISFDRYGKVAWKKSFIEDNDPGYGNRHIIEIVTGKCDKRYLEYLRKINISYIVAGEDCIDLEFALNKLYELFEIKTILLEGGPTINTAFECQNLIDELSIVEVDIDGDEADKDFFIEKDFSNYEEISSIKIDNYFIKNYNKK